MRDWAQAKLECLMHEWAITDAINARRQFRYIIKKRRRLNMKWFLTPGGYGMIPDSEGLGMVRGEDGKPLEEWKQPIAEDEIDGCPYCTHSLAEHKTFGVCEFSDPMGDHWGRNE